MASQICSLFSHLSTPHSVAALQVSPGLPRSWVLVKCGGTTAILGPTPRIAPASRPISFATTPHCFVAGPQVLAVVFLLAQPSCSNVRTCTADPTSPTRLQASSTMMHIKSIALLLVLAFAGAQAQALAAEKPSLIDVATAANLTVLIEAVVVSWPGLAAAASAALLLRCSIHKEPTTCKAARRQDRLLTQQPECCCKPLLHPARPLTACTTSPPSCCRPLA